MIRKIVQILKKIITVTASVVWGEAGYLCPIVLLPHPQPVRSGSLGCLFPSPCHDHPKASGLCACVIYLLLNSQMLLNFLQKGCLPPIPKYLSIGELETFCVACRERLAVCRKLKRSKLDMLGASL